jgi:RNA polymerase sigma-70 factor (ECF subfamily)
MRRKGLIEEARAKITDSSPVSFNDAREQYEALIFAFVSRRIRPVEEAEDIVAHVFVDAFIQWRRLRGAPKNWLLGIARRKVCDALRKQKRLWSLQEGDASASALDGFIEAVEVRQAITIVMSLPEDQRDAYLFQVLEQLSIDEIAQVMNRSSTSVNSLLQRARTRIQKALDTQQREGATQ